MGLSNGSLNVSLEKPGKSSLNYASDRGIKLLIINDFYFRKTLHHRCLRGFRILNSNVLSQCQDLEGAE